MADNQRLTTYALATVAAVIASTGGCSSQAPCLQYQPQTHTRIISLRGHGVVTVSEQALVCALRAPDAQRLLDPSP